MSGPLKLLILAGVILLGAWLWFGVARSDETRRLTFLAVGQGDCIVWQDSGAVLLIDTGPKTREGFDGGARIVLPKLRKMGIQRVDLILITHPDADHIGGLQSVLRRYPSAKVVLSAEFRENPEMKWWLAESKVSVEKLIWIDGKSRLNLPTSTIEVASSPMNEDTNDNDGSLFARIECGTATAVLTGDASTTTEEAMQEKLKWTGQVLKAGHHGSRSSTSEVFLKSLRSKWAVISCGKDNRFDHPHKSVLATLARQGVDVFRTDLQGDIAFDVSEKGFQPQQEAHGH